MSFELWHKTLKYSFNSCSVLIWKKWTLGHEIVTLLYWIALGLCDVVILSLCRERYTLYRYFLMVVESKITLKPLSWVRNKINFCLYWKCAVYFLGFSTWAFEPIQCKCWYQFFVFSKLIREYQKNIGNGAICRRHFHRQNTPYTSNFSFYWSRKTGVVLFWSLEHKLDLPMYAKCDF